MSDEAPQLTRGFFGYSKKGVERLLTTRDLMLRQAEGRVRSAEARLSELEGEREELRRENERLTQELGAARDELQRMRAGEPAADVRMTAETSAAAFTSEELAPILLAAEESARRMVERAQSSIREQLEDAERAWRDAQDQVERFRVWRERVEPAVSTSQARIQDVRTRIEDVPSAIRQALAPLADSIAALDTSLVDVGSVAAPPLLLTPSGFVRDRDARVSRSERGGIRRARDTGESA